MEEQPSFRRVTPFTFPRPASTLHKAPAPSPPPETKPLAPVLAKSRQPTFTPAADAPVEVDAEPEEDEEPKELDTLFAVCRRYENEPANITSVCQTQEMARKLATDIRRYAKRQETVSIHKMPLNQLFLGVEYTPQLYSVRGLDNTIPYAIYLIDSFLRTRPFTINNKNLEKAKQCIYENLNARNELLGTVRVPLTDNSYFVMIGEGEPACTVYTENEDGELIELPDEFWRDSRNREARAVAQAEPEVEAEL